mmetsp:Transcript_9553/g.20963  ORF Transcript_9553/g.20963 Transcript_9553/m.20963 type:complete len:103 (-) Transcript_9553:1624-1932(-)
MVTGPFQVFGAANQAPFISAGDCFPKLLYACPFRLFFRPELRSTCRARSLAKYMQEPRKLSRIKKRNSAMMGKFAMMNVLHNKAARGNHGTKGVQNTCCSTA